MKTLVIIPVGVSAALIAAAAVMRLAGLPAHGRELAIAALVVIVAAEAGAMPAILLRNSTEPTFRAQAALGGTVLHMLLTIALAGAVVGLKLVDMSHEFAYRLTGAYWASLVTLCWVLLRVSVGKTRASEMTLQVK